MRRRKMSFLALARTEYPELIKVRSSSSFSSDDDENNLMKQRAKAKRSRHRGHQGSLLPILWMLLAIAFLYNVSFSTWCGWRPRTQRRFPVMAVLPSPIESPNQPPPPTSPLLRPSTLFQPPPFEVDEWEEEEIDELGGLAIESLAFAHHFERRIAPTDQYWFDEDREMALDAMDDWNIESGGKLQETYEESSIDGPECQPLSWHDTKHQVCNNLHEQDLDLSDRHQNPELQYNFKFLGQGFYRQGLLLEPVGVDGPPLVLKMLHLYRPLNQRQLIKVNNEALLMERLTSAPTITNTYGHCGTSILVEEAAELSGKMIRQSEDKTWRGFIPQEELQQLERDNGGVYQFNPLEPHEKLDIAIAMAESIALLHGFPDGIVVHDDLSVDQWMIATSDGRVMLNDLNSVLPLKWDHFENRYCTFQSRTGNLKSPEYFDFNGQMTEQSDIVPMGHLLFVLLTGLLPFHNEHTYKDIDRWVKDGNLPKLNPAFRSRSLIERRMANIMDGCLALYPDDRLTIFGVVQELQATRMEHNERQRAQWSRDNDDGEFDP